MKQRIATLTKEQEAKLCEAERELNLILVAYENKEREKDCK